LQDRTPAFVRLGIAEIVTRTVTSTAEAAKFAEKRSEFSVICVLCG